MDPNAELSQKIEKVTAVDKKTQTEALEGIQDSQRADNFQTALNKANSAVAVQEPVPVPPTAQTEKVSPLTLASQVYGQKVAPPTSPDKLNNAIQHVTGQINQIQESLTQPGAQIPSGYQDLLESHLQHADDALQVALQKAGLETNSSEPSTGMASALEKFLTLLTRSQGRINSLAGEVQHLAHKPQFNAADFLGIQLKVHFVSQEMELFANLLNKGLESTKTLLNVQV